MRIFRFFLLWLFIRHFWLYFSEIFTQVRILRKATILKISWKFAQNRDTHFSTLALYIMSIRRWYLYRMVYVMLPNCGKKNLKKNSNWFGKYANFYVRTAHFSLSESPKASLANPFVIACDLQALHVGILIFYVGLEILCCLSLNKGKYVSLA